MTTRNKIRWAHLITITLLSSSALAYEQNASVDGLMLHGFDPVAYFYGQPQLGTKKHSVTHNNYTYHFVSQKNMELFSTNYEKYTPQFGGYCAYGVSLGKKFDIDPYEYKIHQEKLYLMLNRATKEIWTQHSDRNIAVANRLWPSLKTISPAQLSDD